MADQRRPFQFRLPWMPPTAAPAPAPARPVAEPRAPAPAPAPAPARPVAEPRAPAPARPVSEPRPRAPAPAPARPVAEPPRQPVAAPARPPFRPAGVAPAQPSPRAEPPPPAPASVPPRAATQPRGTARPPSPSRVGAPLPPPPPPPRIEQPSAPRSTTEPSIAAVKPNSPPPTPPSEPLAAAEPQTATPEPTSPSKTGSSSTVSTTKEATIITTQPISPPKPARQSPSPLSPEAASKPSSPSPSAARSKYSTPYSSSPASPREKLSPPTLPDPRPSPDPIQNSGTSTPYHDESQEVKRALDEPIIKQNGEPNKKEVTQLSESIVDPEPETAVHPVAVPRGQSREEVFQRKEVVTTSGAENKPAETFIPSYPKVGRPHNHKPAGEKAPLVKEIKEDVSKFVNRLGAGQGKLPLDGDKQLTVITLAGENRGASMTLSNEARKKESSIRIHRGYKANPDESVETSTDGEESSKGKGKLSDSKTDEETATKAYINSNVQGINNSLLFNGSVSTMNPGVQYVRSHSLPETSKGRHEVGSYETLKAECSATPSEKLAYGPNVRRRCLRGLFLESSDSDAENPEKPRRHGCLYGRMDKNTDKNIGVL